MLRAPRPLRALPSLLALLVIAILDISGAHSADVRGTPAGPSGSSPMAQPAGPAFTLVGHSDLGGQGFNADVAVLGSFAYIGSWGIAIPNGPTACPSLGVRVVDISDPATPRLVATVARFEGTTAEDVVALRVSTPFFRGDLLAVGIQRCGEESDAPAGLALVDVTDPRNPVELGFYDSGPALEGVHELDVLVRDGRVLALLAIPDDDPEGGEDEFRIVDVSNPRQPALLASWDLQARLGPIPPQGCFPTVIDHSAKASRDGMRVYLSYWDAGIIILDIADPAAPRMIARLAPPLGEGSYHSVDEMDGGLLLVAQEYPFGPPFPTGLFLRVDTGSAAEEFYACEYRMTGPASIVRTGPVSGTLVYGGDACSLTADAAAGRVVVAELGGCPVGEKARQAQVAGARALIVSAQPTGAPEPLMREDVLELPMLGIPPDQFARLRALAGAGSAMVTLPTARPFGGIHVWDIRDPANPVLRGTFHTENARRFPPRAPGTYTAHNPLVIGNYALVSWFSDGVRLLDLSDPTNPREVDAFVPPAVPDPQNLPIFPPNAAMVWGVALAGDVVLISDVHGGLYVLRLSGIALPVPTQPTSPAAPKKGD